MNHDARTRTAYHESGHAVASAKRGGHVNYIDLGGGEPETEAPVEGSCNRAFMIWAGPWAQTYLEGNCTTDRIADLFHGQSLCDWPQYEEAMDPLRAAEVDVRGLAAAVEFAELVPDDHPKKNQRPDLPPVTAPDPGWHDELTAAWPEVEMLAESLLDGESPIKLSNGQELVRFQGRDYWFDPGRVEDPRPR